MRRNLGTAAIACAAIISIAGCSSSTSSTASRAPSGSASAAVTATAPATAPATTPTATPSATQAPKFTTPEAAAKHLYSAWEANDKTAAAQSAAPEVISLMFSQTWTAGKYTFGGCSTDTECDYNYADGAIQMIITGSAKSGYTVVSITFGSAG
jgi:hypothetical protein